MLLSLWALTEITKGILKVGEVTTEELLALDSPLDVLVKGATEYLKKFGIDHLLVVCDELETAVKEEDEMKS